MCQVHLITSLTGELEKIDKKQFNELMFLGSHNNPHAYGLIGVNFTYKNAKAYHKEDYRKRLSLIGQCGNKLIGHNRYATQGDHSNLNNHPFKTKDYTLVHNGVLSNDDVLKESFGFEYKEKVDSFIIIQLLQHFKDEGLSTLESIQESVPLISGYYSVFVKENSTGDIYYFKNSTAEFTFCLYEFTDRVILGGSTRKENLEALYTCDKYIFSQDLTTKRTYQEAEAGTIYHITDSSITIAGYFDEYEAKDWELMTVSEVEADVNSLFEDHERQEEIDYLSALIEEDGLTVLGYSPDVNVTADSVYIILKNESDTELIGQAFPQFEFKGKLGRADIVDCLELYDY